MMIELVNAVITHGAVRTPRRSVMAACGAKFGGDSVFINGEFPCRRTNAANTKDGTIIIFQGFNFLANHTVI